MNTPDLSEFLALFPECAMALDEGAPSDWWEWRLSVVTPHNIANEGWRALRTGKTVNYYKAKQ